MVANLIILEQPQVGEACGETGGGSIQTEMKEENWCKLLEETCR